MISLVSTKEMDKGVVDCCDSIAFDEALASLREKWDDIELHKFIL